MPEDRATDYARAVIAGTIVAGPHIRAACRRHLSDIELGHQRGLRWDNSESERVIRYFAAVLTVEVGDDVRPFILRPWQCFVVGSLFGWFATVPEENDEGKLTGSTVEIRRFRRAYVEIAKGNGKSPMAAGIGHYMHSAYGKVRSEVYSAATDQDQAMILFRDAVAMYERSPRLQGLLTESGQGVNIWQLSYEPRGGVCIYKPISSAKKGKSGIRPDCALIDEVHEHPDNSVIEMLRAGTKGKQNALIFEITNSGFDMKSVCGVEHEKSIRVINGDEPNDAWFSFVCSLDEGDEPFEDETCWIKANPNLGVSINSQYIREQVNEAKGMPSKEGLVRRLNFCQWTESEHSAIPRELWMKCEAVVDLDLMLAEGWRCFGGLDLSRVNDLSAFTLTWLPVETKDQWRFVSKTWFWTPADTLKARAKRDRAPYDTWADKGFLEAVPGKILKFGWIADALLDICAKYHPVMIGCDEYGLKQLIEKLEEMGQTLPCVVHPQGFQKRHTGDRPELEGTGADKIELWMPDSINKFEAALLEERITVDTNPVMRMCSQGVVFTQNRTGHRMFDKDRATTRIDGMISQAMSIGVATLESRNPGSIFDHAEWWDAPAKENKNVAVQPTH